MKTSRAVLVAVASFATGVAVAAAVAVPQHRSAWAEVFATRSDRDRLQQEVLDLRDYWGFQVAYMESVPSDGGMTRHGVHLARITSVDATSGAITVRWFNYERDKPPAADPSRLPQTLDPLMVPGRMFLVQRPLYEGEDATEDLAPQVVDDPDQFLASLARDDDAGRSLRESFWWVTVLAGDYIQLVQAPIPSS